MKTAHILASLALALPVALTGSLAMAAPSDTTRAEVKADVARARADGQLEPAATYEVTPRVEHRKAPRSELTRAQVREETREYLREHPNRVAEEYAPFNYDN